MRSSCRRVLRLFGWAASWAVSWAALALGLWGCPGSLKDPAEFEAREETGGSDLDGSVPDTATPADGAGTLPPPGDGGCGAEVPSAIFTPICATAVCHSTNFHQSGLDLTSPIHLAALINQPTVEADGGFLLINASSPLQSALYTKLGESPPFPVQMPYGMTPLSADQIQCVGEWIVAQVSAMDPAGKD